MPLSFRTRNSLRFVDKDTHQIYFGAFTVVRKIGGENRVYAMRDYIIGMYRLTIFKISPFQNYRSKKNLKIYGLFPDATVDDHKQSAAVSCSAHQ